MRTLFSKSKRGWIWPLLLATVIFFASGRSHVAAPAVPHIDKIAHFCVYGLLATLVVRLGRASPAPWIALVVVMAYGLTDEWHQSFTQGRSVELADWIADTLGAFLAMMLYTRLRWYRRTLEQPLWFKPRIEKTPAVATVCGA